MKKVVSACAVSLMFVSPSLAQDWPQGQQMPSIPSVNINMQVQQTNVQSGDMPQTTVPSNEVPQTTVRQTTVRQTTVYTTSGAMQPASPPPAADCGAGLDPDCAATRHGLYPMDADSFRGLLEALRGNPNELERQDMVKSTLQGSALTAKQLALVLDLFQNEILRMEVAETAAPVLVMPKHALGLASKFKNSIHKSDFAELINAQRD